MTSAFDKLDNIKSKPAKKINEELDDKIQAVSDKHGFVDDIKPIEKKSRRSNSAKDMTYVSMRVQVNDWNKFVQ